MILKCLEIIVFGILGDLWIFTINVKALYQAPENIDKRESESERDLLFEKSMSWDRQQNTQVRHML